MAFEGEKIYFTDQSLLPDNQQLKINESDITKKFKLFLSEWTEDNKTFPYKERLISHLNDRKHFLVVSYEDILSHDEELAKWVRDAPEKTLPLFEQATHEVITNLQITTEETEIPRFQIQIVSDEMATKLRELKSTFVNKLVTISGIIVQAQRPILKAEKIHIQCRNCKSTKDIFVERGLSGTAIPQFCDRVQGTGPSRESCPPNSYVIIPRKSELVDQQHLKIQENPEMIPTGEIPRTFRVVVDRHLVDRLAPGSRVKITGIFAVSEDKFITQKAGTKGLKSAYIIALGLTRLQSGTKEFESRFKPEEKEKFLQMSKDPKIVQKIQKSIASAIYGRDDEKKAIACLLFSGSQKTLPDNMRLRGDINILLIGDPSTAKSQLLKFVERVAPICIYTSGKGSSAAGLTASIIKDPSTGEFQLEGGALVLADGGIVCIDEFDKMRPQDRVAIHEAMEQQTISIAKAGITTILNSRTSVLAAANPLFGKYDDLRQISDQIDLQTTILSRFDCIFIVRDLRNTKNDIKVASHVIDLHKGNMMETEGKDEINLLTLKKYIAYARSRISPRLTKKAAQELNNLYVEDRKRAKIERNTNKKRNNIPITVRQLEAIIRLSEALAKMQLNSDVHPEHVREAHRIFQVSTLNAIHSGLDTGIEVPAEIAKLVMRIEDTIKRKVTIGRKISHQKLADDLTKRFDNMRAVEYAIVNLIKRGDFQHVEGR